MGVMTLSLMTFIKMNLLSILIFQVFTKLALSTQYQHKKQIFRNRCQQEPTHYCQACKDTEAELPDSTMDVDVNLEHEPACRKALPVDKNQTQFANLIQI
jgi:hypothetical protein